MGALVRCNFNTVPHYLDLNDYQPLPECVGEIAIQQTFKFGYEVVQNAIYALLGMGGKYLMKHAITGRLGFNPSNSSLLKCTQKSMLLRLGEAGFFHDQLQKFSKVTTESNALGSMSQALAAKLKLELNEYRGQVSQLQDVLNKHREAQLQMYVDRQQNWIHRKLETLTLLKLITWYLKPLYRLQWLTKIADACQLKKGGELVSVIYDFLSTGDPHLYDLARDVLTVCCTPLVRMISKWMLEGHINDKYNEFFIESLPEVGADRLWHDKFRLRLNMLPKFISLELADKILKTGKSINFLREICKIDEPVKGREELKDIIDNHVSQIFSFVPDTSWHSAIETCYSQTSKHVLDIMVGPHKLLVHLQGMRNYLLLGQGDFVGIFIENIKGELDKLGTDIYNTYDLSSMLDAALRSTNAQYDDPDILDHLDVVVRSPYPGDCGWDVISLQYTLQGPLATMLEPAMPTYKTLFKPLWRMKHMEFVLSTKIWKEQMYNAKALRELSSEIGHANYKLHFFTSELMHFLHEMLYYVLFEVIECSWVGLQKRMSQATDLDEILDEHSKFLEAIGVGCFVKTSKERESHLEVLYGSIINLVKLQTEFYDNCFEELNARKKMSKAIADSERAGHFGVTTAQKLERNQKRKIFLHKVYTFCHNLEEYSTAYGKAIGVFLLELNSSSNPNLQLFGTRLDFNEYYKKRDTNLSKPLTFEHMRLSNVMGTSKDPTAGTNSIHPIEPVAENDQDSGDSKPVTS
ncbi:gamma-tubulin complex component 3-like [Drosophila innubila]|uniref:gamma-tubulin complex component 3-like n=1 Tax=Drosophila innubila TaxID=198719 RepID=UPI00148E4947|nr:gamma-tubulin complex component 3-like [Drosophila innubila]